MGNEPKKAATVTPPVRSDDDVPEMLNALEPLIKLPSKGLVTARPGGFETANVKVADLDDPEASVAVATKVCVPDVVLTVNW